MTDKITPNSDQPFDWSHSLSAEDAKYWRQEEVQRLNPTGEMNLIPIPHTNEGEATNWMMGVDLLTVKRQEALIIKRAIRYTIRLGLAIAALGSFMFLIGAIQTYLRSTH